MRRYYTTNNKVNLSSLSLNKIAQFILFSLYFSQSASAENNSSVEFNSSFLRSTVDVSAFSQGNPVAAGNHTVDLYLNEKWKGRTEVHFENAKPGDSVAQPCFTIKTLALLGIDTAHLSPEGLAQLNNGGGCVHIASLATGLSANYDVASQQLQVQSPQIYLLRNARGYVSPELWDNGITAATLQYDYNAWHSEMSNADSMSTQYLGLRGGINWDVWRLRYRGTFNWNKGQGWHYDNTSTYLERAIVPLRSKLVMGESTTDGQVFDSVGFRGIMVTSDDRMYEDSQRGYAPVVNGIANTNALVRVSQRGVRIYETTVPPGPFVINDLYPTGTGGDLLVTVKEADGSEHSFTVTYASIAELLRPGTTRYTLMAGRYHNSSVNEKPQIAMGTLRHGFTNLLTGYTGALGGNDYQSVAAGIALNTPVGAISSDITHARTTLRNDVKREGQSVRVTYAKILPVVNTNVTLASYRYSSSGYYDIDDAMLLRSGQWGYVDNYTNSINRKNRIQVSASQTLSDTLGSFNLSASMQDYWNRDGSDKEYQVGYTNAFKHFNLNVNASRTRDLVNSKWDNKIAIGISLPLGNSAQAMYLNSTYVQERDHQGVQNSVAGSAGTNRQYNYSAFTNVDHYKDNGTKTTGGLSGGWTSPWTTVGGSFSAGNGYQQYGMNLSGGAIAYRNGVVLTPIMGDTMAIIEADHASGAKVTNNSSLSLDGSGKAAVPYLTPYRQNTIELDPKGLSNDVSLDVTSQNSVPTSGAVVLLKYKTDIGHSVLFNVNHSGEELPFGAPLVDENNNTVGYIAQGGQSFARVKNERGALRVRWGNDTRQQCTIRYQLTVSSPTDALRQQNVVCQ
ncbi:TPA: fimbrial biogenesis outer membrane usher protein [Klebsiella pneumoniae]|nr:fimbrial biogenesis outer membrane usher protein [Klebsiella pneumoniae]